MRARTGSSEVIVIVAPLGADAANIAAVLGKAGLASTICPTVGEAARWIDLSAGALLVTEEAVSPEQNPALVEAFERQPPWSDIPLLILASENSIHRWAALPVAVFGARSNVTLVARPLQGSTLTAAAHAVLRARRRQYELRDILEERDALLASLELRVRERTAKLQELVAELESFSYSVSHDLRAPMRVMAGYAKILLEDFGATLTPEARHYVERIARSAERLDLLTQDVLAYTRLARGEMELAPVDLDQAVDETLEQLADFDRGNGTLAVRRPLGVVIAHAPSLVQVLSNLLGNALKFARPGVPPTIEISTEAAGGRLKILVRDNGVGIPAAYHEKIFRMFERVAGQEIPGTGIGLAIVKKAAERMGGTVGVISTPGEGATFWVELPQASAPGIAAPASGETR